MLEGAPRKRRFFVGIALDQTTRAATAAVGEELRRMGFAARLEASEKLHVTLAFLGFVEPARSESIVEALTVVAARSAQFTVLLDKIGAFPHARKPRVVYVGARDQGAAFRALASEIRNAYANLGFEFAQDPVAHVTIARVKESGRPLPLVEFPAIPLVVESLALFESLPDLANNTSRYEVTRSVSLSGSS